MFLKKSINLSFVPPRDLLLNLTDAILTDVILIDANLTDAILTDVN